ncbi:MAG: DUF3124 domain-containing protein [Limnoraphis robusta]|jgi:hypothetical protein
MLNAHFLISLLITSVTVISLTSCTRHTVSQSSTTSTADPQETYLQVNPVSTTETVNLESLKIVAGQTIYVPVYSHIYYMNTRRIYNLATTLSVRNTDLDHSIIIKTVNYYNTEGKLVQSYLDQAIRLSPLASTDFFVEQSNSKGGSGANFIVEWIAEETVSEPMIEAVSIGTSGTQGIAFTSPSRVIKTTPK